VIEFVTDKKEWRDTMDKFEKRNRQTLEYLKKSQENSDDYDE
jgi:hypothetical protein